MVRQGDFTPADPDHAADLFDLTAELTNAAGLPAYEISNHARLGAESRHNLTYWRYGDYAGIGPGAHGRRGGLATARHKKPENWRTALERNSHGCQTEDPLTPQERAREALLMGLRLNEGVDLAAIAKRCGVAQEQLINLSAFDQLNRLGFAELDGHRLQITPRGMLLLDAILAEIVAV